MKRRETVAVKHAGIAIALAVLLGAPPCAYATERTWVGGTSGSWSTASNWSPEGVPSGSDVAVFSPSGHTTVTVANNTKYCSTLRFSSGATTFECEGTFAYTSFDSAPTGVVEVADTAVFTNKSVRIEKNKTFTIVKKGTGTWVQKAQVTYDGSSAPCIFCVDEGRFELYHYIYINSLYVRPGATFFAKGASLIGRAHPGRVHVDGTLDLNVNSQNPKFTALSGSGKVVNSVSSTSVELVLTEDCRFDGTIAVSELTITSDSGGDWSLTAGACNAFAGVTKVIAGNALKFAPGVGIFRFKTLKVPANSELNVEDEDGNPISVICFNEAEGGATLVGCGNLISETMHNTLTGAYVRTTGALLASNTTSSTVIELRLGNAQADFDFSQAAFSKLGSYGKSRLCFQNTSAIVCDIPVVGNGEVYAGASGFTTPSVTLGNLSKSGEAICIYAPLVLNGGESNLAFSGFKFKKAGVSLTINGGEFYQGAGTVQTATWARQYPVRHGGTIFGTDSVASDSRVVQNGGTLYHGGTYNAAAKRYDLNGGRLVLTQTLQPPTKAVATAESPAVYCFNGGVFAPAPNLTAGNFNNGLFARGNDQQGNPSLGRLVLRVGPRGARLSSTHADVDSIPSATFNLPLSSETEGSDGGVMIDGRMAYVFSQPISISGDVRVRDGGIVLPNAADTATTPRFFGAGGFLLRNAALAFNSCTSDKNLKLATAEGKGVSFEGAGLIYFRAGTGGVAQTLESGPLTRVGKGSVLFLNDGDSNTVGGTGGSKYTVAGGVATKSNGLVELPVVATRNNKLEFLSYDDDAGFIPLPTAVSFESATAVDVAYSDPGAGKGNFVQSGQKTVAALHVKSGYVTINESALLTVGSGQQGDCGIVLLNGATADILGSGTLDFGAAEGIFCIPAKTTAASASIAAKIGGSGGVSFASSPDSSMSASYRWIALSGANTYTGGTFINAVRLELNNANALGSGTVTIGGGMSYGGRLAFAVNATIGNDFKIGGYGIRNTKWNGFENCGALECHANVRLTGSVELTEPARFTVPEDGKRLTIAGTMSGDALEVLHDAAAAAGTVELAGHNTYTGGTDVARGTLALVHGDSAGTGRVRLDSGILRFENDSSIVFNNDIDGVGTVELAGGYAVDFTGDKSKLTAPLRVCAKRQDFNSLPPFSTIENGRSGVTTIRIAGGLGTIAWNGRSLGERFKLFIGEGTTLDLGGSTLTVYTAMSGTGSRVVNGTLVEVHPESGSILIFR